MDKNSTTDNPLDITPNTMEDFYDDLQELVINQARNMINLNLYTKSLLSTLPVALIATNTDGIVKTLNQAAEEILGIREKEIVETELSQLFKKGSEIAVKIHNALREGRPTYLNSTDIFLSSGKEIVANISIQPIKDEEDAISGILLTVEDTTYVHFLQDAFKRYVPSSVSELIAEDPKSLKLGGEQKHLTVLFSDLKGFTAYSEQYSPEEMVALLSDYFTEMTDMIFQYEGTLKEYVGDELMAIFGAPVVQEDHAKRACHAALAMKKRLNTLRSEWAAKGRPELQARTGINTGIMLVGNLGSKHRFSYGVLGDQVNLASRLEGMSNIYGTEILLGENTAEIVKDAFILSEIDHVKVKGREKPVTIFELIDEAGSLLPKNRKNSLASYARGLDAYRKQQWDDAIIFFAKTIKLWPDDGPAKIMTKRCNVFKTNPPPSNWDGIFEHATKK